MIQIGLIVVAIGVFAMGIKALSSGSIQLSKDKTIEGSAAKGLGVAVIVFGVVLVLFALVGLPMLMSM